MAILKARSTKLDIVKITSTRRKPLTRVRIATLLFALLLALPVLAEDQSASEQAVKAAIVYKIAKFVSWPDDAFPADFPTLRICVPAGDPIASAMDALAGKFVQGRQIEVSRFEDAKSVSRECAILFLGQSAVLRRPSLLADVANAPVLTIGDSADFIDIGGIVTLQVENNRVQFAINVGASDRAGLGISAQLLQLAKLRE